MATNRRNLLKAGLFISSAQLLPEFALAGQHVTRYMGCVKDSAGDYAVAVLDNQGKQLAKSPLPGRGHGLALHPNKQLAIAIARRPGTYLMVFDTDTGKQLDLHQSQQNRFYFGHGIFSADGLLYLSEGESGTSNGLIGIYKYHQKLEKVAELPGLGFGPHELVLHPDGQHLVIAVGGIQTQGRNKINLHTMQPSLVYLNRTTGKVSQRVNLPHHQLSIRHLAVDNSGLVVFGQQYQWDDGETYPLLYSHRLGHQTRPLGGELEDWLRFNDYIGSVAIGKQHIVATSPRGGCYGIWHKNSGQLQGIQNLSDVCGAALTSNGNIALSSGEGTLLPNANNRKTTLSTQLHWDNHWIAS